jgi:hypothetical protein
MENAVDSKDTSWWKVLFEPYADVELTQFATSMNNNFTPSTTPARCGDNSPEGIIQDYERRLQHERRVVESFQTDYDNMCTENMQQRAEIEKLQNQLEQ